MSNSELLTEKMKQVQDHCYCSKSIKGQPTWFGKSGSSITAAVVMQELQCEV